MRQLKTFMRNRKKEMLACGPCECRTLQCWRYANENCGCGESPTPPVPEVHVESIWQPSVDYIEIVEWDYDITTTFTYSPADAHNPIGDILVSSDNESVASVMIETAEDGHATLHITWVAAWDAIVTLTWGDVTYHIDVKILQRP